MGAPSAERIVAPAGGPAKSLSSTEVPGSSASRVLSAMAPKSVRSVSTSPSLPTTVAAITPPAESSEGGGGEANSTTVGAGAVAGVAPVPVKVTVAGKARLSTMMVALSAARVDPYRWTRPDKHLSARLRGERSRVRRAGEVGLDGGHVGAAEAHLALPALARWVPPSPRFAPRGGRRGLR